MSRLFVFLLLFSFFLTSCVGKIEDKNLDKTKTAITTSKEVVFLGLVDAQAVAEDRAAVFFNPAVGVPSELVYEIVVNNSTAPINVRGDSLQQNASGQYTYTISGLYPATTYQFNVNVVNKDGDRGEGKLPIAATTFSNKTCTFDGVSSVSVPSGKTGKSSLEVKWVPALKRSTSPVFKNIQDAYKYQVYMIGTSGSASNIFNESYSGIDRRVEEVAATESSFRFTGLDSGKNYFFAVRCLHEGWRTNNSLQTEKNLRVMSQSTRDNTAIFDFDVSQTQIKVPSGKDGETKRVFTWSKATGDFDHYRLYFKRYATNPEFEPDPFTDSTLLNPEAAIPDGGYVSIDAEDDYYQISGLVSYNFYHFKLIACATTQCLAADRIGIDSTNLILNRIVPKIAPFQGLQSISSPRSSNKITSIWLKAEAPAMSEGHAHKMNLYCLPDKNDKSNRFLGVDGSGFTGATGSCSDLVVAGIIPDTEAEIYTLNEIELSGARSDGAEYCLMMTTVLSNAGSGYFEEDIDNAIVKCITPEIVAPTAEEFKGKDSCSPVGSSSSQIQVSWSKPTGGISEGYFLYYKDRENGQTFNFFKAIYETENTFVDYKTSVQITDLNVTSYILTGLIPGHSYEIGLLTYVDDGVGGKKYSQYNLNTGACSVPLPEFDFQEWTNVLALGPKTNELFPKTMDAYYVMESLDSLSRPYELIMKEDSGGDITEELSDTVATFGLDGEFSKTDLASNSLEFSGVYGATTLSSSMSTNYKYTNTGVIRFSFKDVKIDIDGSMVDLSDYFINTVSGGGPTLKSSRKYGYKILRSDDNGTTWIDLTHQSFGYQTTNNAGLVLASQVNVQRAHAGESLPGGSEWEVTFTDYSVRAEKMNNWTERARVYWYKIVPIFDGKEMLVSQSSSNSEHNKIRITLPPPNMALVHRWMSNRAWCKEIGRVPDTSVNMNYTCPYNGVGSRGAGFPWRQGESVIDLGGDLLVDRFELGCSFTRGDITQIPAENKSQYVGSNNNFQGLNSLTPQTEFKGCVDNNTYTNLISQIDVGPNSGNKWNQVARGDCIGNHIELTMPLTFCSDPGKVNYSKSLFPGTNVYPSPDCQVETFQGGGTSTKFNMEENQVQAQAGSVFYTRTDWQTRDRTFTPEYKAPGGGILKNSRSEFANSCFLNLPYINAGNEMRPRWFETTAVFEGIRNSNTGNTTKLLNLTLGEALSESEFYNSTDVKAPTVDTELGNTPISRLFASNGSNLPPLDGANQEMAYNLCQAFEVEVGVNYEGGSYTTVAAKQKKRILRRKEYVAASAWASQMKEGDITLPATNIANNGTIFQTESLECNSSSKSVSGPVEGSDVNEIGEVFSANFPFVTRSSTVLLTGTNISNGVNHSGKCVSRYGIQDIVGNIPENVSDQLFCYADEKIMFNTQGSTLASDDPEWEEADSLFFEKSIFESLFFQIFRDSSYTGSCSLNEKAANRTYEFIIPGSNIVSNIFTELSGSTVNTSVVPFQKSFDIESLNQARNGDGYFLDFGNERLGPNLQDPNTLENNIYFNHILGIPMACSGSSCNETSDNKLIHFQDNFATPLDTTGYSLSSVNGVSFADDSTENFIYKFPYSNSSFTNIGTIQTTVESLNYDPLGATSNYAFTYYDSASYDGGMGTWTKTTADSLDAVSLLQTRRIRFSLSRSEPIISLKSGGAYRGSRASRYSVDFKSGSKSSAVNSYQDRFAGRCTVLINQ